MCLVFLCDDFYPFWLCDEARGKEYGALRAADALVSVFFSPVQLMRAQKPRSTRFSKPNRHDAAHWREDGNALKASFRHALARSRGRVCFAPRLRAFLPVIALHAAEACVVDQLGQAACVARAATFLYVVEAQGCDVVGDASVHDSVKHALFAHSAYVSRAPGYRSPRFDAHGWGEYIFRCRILVA